jgi:hypothetical protein
MKTCLACTKGALPCDLYSRCNVTTNQPHPTPPTHLQPTHPPTTHHPPNHPTHPINPINAPIYVPEQLRPNKPKSSWHRWLGGHAHVRLVDCVLSCASRASQTMFNTKTRAYCLLFAGTRCHGATSVLVRSTMSLTAISYASHLDRLR